MGWLSGWTGRLREARDARILRRRPIPDPLWQAALARYPFIAMRSAADRATLRRLATLFLARKEFTGAGGLVADDEIAVAIAMQACLPILAIGLDAYDGFVGIVVHPDEVIARRESVDENGVVHAWRERLSGEAMSGGPMMLSWRDVAQAGETAEIGYNVVIHEFVHVLDLLDGVADGVPPLPGRAARSRWQQTMEREFSALQQAVDDGIETLLDPYGAESPEEFFAVAAEAFFVTPHRLAEARPALYRLLSDYFRQDPAAGLG